MKIRGYLRRTDLSRCIEPDEASSCRDCPTRRASEHDLFCLTAIHVALHGGDRVRTNRKELPKGNGNIICSEKCVCDDIMYFFRPNGDVA